MTRCVPVNFCPKASGNGVSSAIYNPVVSSSAIAAGTSLFLTCTDGEKNHQFQRNLISFCVIVTKDEKGQVLDLQLDS